MAVNRGYMYSVKGEKNCFETGTKDVASDGTIVIFAMHHLFKSSRIQFQLLAANKMRTENNNVKLKCFHKPEKRMKKKE